MEGGEADQELQAGREVLQYADGGAAALGCGLGATKVRILPKAACTRVCSFSKGAGCLRIDNTVRTNGYLALLPPQNRLLAYFMFPATALFLWL